MPESLPGFTVSYLIPSSTNDWQPRWILQLCGFPPVAKEKNDTTKDIE